MMKALLALFALAGCASGFDMVPGPSGGMGYNVWCRYSWTYCYREAGRLCPHGYAVVSQGEGMLIECRAEAP